MLKRDGTPDDYNKQLSDELVSCLIIKRMIMMEFRKFWRSPFGAAVIYITSMVLVSAISIGYARSDLFRTGSKAMPAYLLESLISIKSAIDVGVNSGEFGKLVRDATTQLAVAKSNSNPAQTEVLNKAELAISVSRDLHEFWNKNSEFINRKDPFFSVSSHFIANAKSIPVCGPIPYDIKGYGLTADGMGDKISNRGMFVYLARCYAQKCEEAEKLNAATD